MQKRVCSLSASASRETRDFRYTWLRIAVAAVQPDSNSITENGVHFCLTRGLVPVWFDLT